MPLITSQILSGVAIKVGTQIALRLYKKVTEADVDDEVRSAFDDALRAWSANEGVREIMRSSLLSLVENQAAETTKSEEWTAGQQSFFWATNLSRKELYFLECG